MPFGQIVRIRHNYSGTVDCATQMGVEAGRLKEKKYPREIMDNGLIGALGIDREECLKKYRWMGSKDNKKCNLSFVIRYTNNARDI